VQLFGYGLSGDESMKIINYIVPIGFLAFFLFDTAAFAQAASPAQQAPAPPPPPAQAPTKPKSARARIARWIEIQNATLNLRYRFIDTSAGVVTTNQLQHRESLRARVKFDRPGRYSLNAGIFTGTRFTSGWDNTGWGINDAQKNLAFKAFYFSAQPVTGLEAQYGGIYIVKGESTELTTYDEDGYVIGGRLSLRRPRQWYFDEISATVAYLTGNVREIAISKRLKYLNDSPNYHHFLVDKKFPRVAVSADFTNVDGARTWREAVNVKTQELRFVDTVIFENYQRTSVSPDQGFAVTLDKAVHRQVSVNWGYASIDPRYGVLNADRFQIGNRVFVMAIYNISPQFLASYFITRAVGRNGALSQRTLMNLVFTYNALPDLRRTGLF
jgi:hypothetical protein